MTNLVMASAVTGILAVSLAACGKSADSTSSPEANTSLGNEIDDALITTRVKAALMTDLQLKSNDVKVETRKGEVLLSGFVENQSQLDEAMRMTRAVEGVKSIQNNVAIKGAATTVGKQVDDSIITGKVKAALMSDSSIQSRDIAVVTRNDEVQLSGFVSSQEQMDKAVSIASAVEGVYRVSNEMKIKK
ncbi:transporter [Limnohabitans sp. T6-5]|nr:transporter [Limnohabitans sp. T6-5]